MVTSWLSFLNLSNFHLNVSRDATIAQPVRFIQQNRWQILLWAFCISPAKGRSTVQTLSSEAPGEEVDSYRGWLLATGSIMKQKSAGRCTPEPLPFQLVISCVLALPAPMAPPRRMTLNGELPCDLN